MMAAVREQLAAVADGSLQWQVSQQTRAPQGLRCRARLETTLTRGLARLSNSKLGQFTVLAAICKTRGSESLLTTGRRIYAVRAESPGRYNNGDNSSESLPAATEELLQDIGGSDSHRESGFVAQKDWPSAAEREYDKEGLRSPQQGYLGLFVRMLGLDHPAEDREEAVKALWRHSMGGSQCVDQIVAFPGTLPLLVSLLPSDRSASSEAAAGLLRNISARNVHRAAVGEAGAVEEITGILTRRAITPEVREQATGCLWNLSHEEKLRSKMEFSELVPILVVMLASEAHNGEAAAGVLANFALDECNHSSLVEAGIIPKLAKLLTDGEGSKIMRREARSILLQLAHDDLYKRTIIEEGLVPVPLIGASAYNSFKPLLDVAPTLADEVKFEPSPSLPSAFGAGKLLLGLNMGSSGYELDEATQLVIEGRSRQQFLARIGLLEKDARNTIEQGEDPVKKAYNVTIMPWWDGIPRLVLILGLEDLRVATFAARTISEIAINEDIRQAIQRAGSIPHLVRLLGSGSEAATEASASALEQLAISYKVRRSIDAHGAVPALVEILKADDVPDFVKDKVLAALDRLSQTGEEVKAMIQSGAFPGLADIAQSSSATAGAKEEAQNILEEMSMRKADSREKIINADGVPVLVAILAAGSPFQKEKAARVMENLAIKEQHADRIVDAGVEHALKSSLDLNLDKGESEASDTQSIIQREESWAAVVAVCRLLNKLLTFDRVRNSIDCKSFALSLAKVLKSDMPLHVKDWASACLLKLDRVVGISTNVSIPLELEINLHDRIPRLIEEAGTSSDSVVQEKAVMQLRDLVLQGVEDYVVAISDLGGIFPLVDLLDKGTPMARVAALSVLYSIGMNEENHPALLRAGAVAHLQRIVRTGSPQWMLALDLLRVLPV